MSEKPATLHIHLQVGAYGVMRLARRLRNDGDFSVWSGAVSPRLSEVSREERDRERRVSVVCLSSSSVGEELELLGNVYTEEMKILERGRYYLSLW